MGLGLSTAEVVESILDPESARERGLTPMVDGPADPPEARPVRDERGDGDGYRSAPTGSRGPGRHGRRSCPPKVDGLPEGFGFHDLRYYFASLLISSGCEVKVVQARPRHASAKTTLDTYGHFWPDADDSTRASIGSVMTARGALLRTPCGLTGS